MQKILLFDNASQVSEQMNSKTAVLFPGRQIDSFIGVDNYNLIAFDFYDIHGDKDSNQLAIYIDCEDLFFFCENENLLQKVKIIIDEETRDEPLDNEQLIYHFFIRLLKNDTGLLHEYEQKITDIEDNFVSGNANGIETIIQYRNELLRLKRYYEQIDIVFDELTANENTVLSDRGVRFCTILGNRTDRLISMTADLRDYIAQVMDVYQSQLDYKQNKLMKVFTVVTTIFLPLTLLVGWYGMNFDMPEFHWAYSYPLVIAASLAIVLILLSFFRHKKWI